MAFQIAKNILDLPLISLDLVQLVLLPERVRSVFMVLLLNYIV